MPENALQDISFSIIFVFYTIVPSAGHCGPVAEIMLEAE